ncbi:hypothetical protein UA32_16750 [Photobacterium angustum]|uniref:Uncharacterized protein n=1 Tax=Photobacterium angustum TaxID=661 RepID=A0ABX5H927_PHOAN|nr:hypothetical protein UA32_16750 [Photobacterium angustum]PSX12184.1 hypothetical protein C0W27_03035 [Photobacterium angustum]
MKLSNELLVITSCLSLLAATSAYSQDIQMRYSSLYGKLKEGHDEVKIRLFILKMIHRKNIG